MHTLLDLKSFIFSEDLYLKGHSMFLALIHGQMLEFCRIIYKILLMRKTNISMEGVTLINNAVAFK